MAETDCPAARRRATRPSVERMARRRWACRAHVDEPQVCSAPAFRGRLPVFALPGIRLGHGHLRAVRAPRAAAAGGHARLQRPVVQARALAAIPNPGRRRGFLRVALTADESGGYGARLTGDQSSGILRSMVAADGLAVIPVTARSRRARWCPSSCSGRSARRCAATRPCASSSPSFLAPKRTCRWRCSQGLPLKDMNSDRRTCHTPSGTCSSTSDRAVGHHRLHQESGLRRARVAAGYWRPRTPRRPRRTGTRPSPGYQSDSEGDDRPRQEPADRPARKDPAR